VTDTFRVVFVCTGNRFRSPLAAAFFQAAAAGVPVETASLGTLELGDAEALPEAVELARQHGVDLREHRASGLQGLDLSGEDLVLGFERKHVAAVVVEAGAPVDRTFTLPELVALLERLPPPPDGAPLVRARAGVAQAHASRPRDFRQAPVPELADPLGGTPAAQHEIAAQVKRLSEHLARRLFSPAAAARGTG
jgi:protein-tyrosine phosphatase